MEPIDLSVLNKRAHYRHDVPSRNEFTGRQLLLPRCLTPWKINEGPSFPRICEAPANRLPWELSRRHGFKHADGRISDRMPVEFSLNSGTLHKKAWNFPAEAVIWSVETYPDLHALAWSLFGYCDEHLVRGLSDCVMLKGAFRAIESHASNIPENLRSADYKECIVAYYPQGSRSTRGWLGEVATAQELPASGIIKDIGVFYEVLGQFVGGIIETNTPDGMRHYGHLLGGNTGKWISCDAIKSRDDKWEYYELDQGDARSLNLIGVRHMNKENSYWDELMGDAFLCSDGTVLHSYHFSRKEFPEMPPIPDDWKDGYYYNRIYPPNSPVIPKHVVDSFEREMPAWFYKANEERKAKMQKSVR